MDNSDKHSHALPKKATKAPAHHSALSEHFQADFPIFLNRWAEGFELREHNHAYYEIVYVMSGEGYHYVGDQVDKTGKGSLYILPVGTSHILRPSSMANNLLVYNLCIRPEFIGELQSRFSSYEDGDSILSIFGGLPGTHIALQDRGMELGPLFESMHREYTERYWGFEMDLFADLLKLVVCIARLLKGASAPAADKVTGKWSRAGLLSILEHIDRHISEPLKLEDIAAGAGISKRHFIRLFHQMTGMGFTDYVQHKRMDMACRLLRETDYKISHIAKSTGYQDTAYFRELFRKIIGTSPRQYRRHDQE